MADKRLTVVETEFAKVLRVSRRENNTLSTILRQCWDDGALRVMTRNSPLMATGAHVSIIGHITPLELRQELKTTDMASGFINRFFLVLVKRRLSAPGRRPAWTRSSAPHWCRDSRPRPPPPGTWTCSPATPMPWRTGPRCTGT